MTIATIDEYNSAFRRTVRIYSGQWPSNMGTLIWGSQAFVSADPGPFGTLASTTTGDVPEAGEAGFPSLGNSGGAQCYLTRVRVNQIEAISGGSDYGRLFLYDRLFHCGEFDMVSGGTFPLSSQPSYASRLPGGSYVGTQLWVECRATGGASNTITVSYTNQSGVAGRSTSKAFSFSARYMYQFPLQSGDSGIQKVDSVTTSFGGGGAGACNILVVRPLWIGVMPLGNSQPTSYYGENECPMEEVGLVPIYETSALCTAVMRTVSSTTNPQFELLMEIVS